MGFHKICRVCLCSGKSKNFDWQTPLFAEPESPSCAECFRYCTQLSSVDIDTVYLCPACLSQLEAAYKFIEKARRSDAQLLVKKEIVDTKAAFELVMVEQNPSSEDLNERENVYTPIEELNCEVELLENISTFEIKREDLNQHSMTDDSYILSNSSNISKEESSASSYEEENFDTVKVWTKHSKATHTDSKTQPAKEDVPEKERKRFKAPKLDGNEEVECEHCGKRLRRKNMRKHFMRHFKPKKLLCHACPQTFREVSALRAHMLTHEKNRERNFGCEQCDRRFFTLIALQKHVQTHNIRRQPAFNCTECDKDFLTKGGYDIHMRLHTNQTIKCTLCDKRYPRPCDLKIHMRTHSGNLPFKCKVCGRAFAIVGVLNKHMRIHEGIKYRCDICSKDYNHQATLMAHRLEHTGLPLKCSICDKSFAKIYKMRRHVQGVHKVQNREEIDKLIIKIKTPKEYVKALLVYPDGTTVTTDLKKTPIP